MDLSNLQQAGFQRATRIIKDTTIFNKQRQMPVIVDTLHPADTIAAAGEFVRTDRLKLDARPTFHFRLKGLNANAFEGVFGFRIFTIGTVTPVALGRDHRFRHRQSVLQRQIAKLARRTGVGFLIPVLNR